MSLQIGDKLGPYEILAPIGKGGMGDVWKARDTRLGRDVAIKICAEQFSERFDREARAIAALNHPHICQIYDVGPNYLVMEYVEGDTLAQRLAKGPLPLEQMLQYAIEMADALDKAHRKGVTHRDLKPGNIILAKSGSKVVDFGLAKLKQDTAKKESKAGTQGPETATITDPLTAQGIVLGTLQYMAPEQVEGRVDEIDARTDIFAFGAVLYEMATGKRAFEGKSQASLTAAILERDPPSMCSLQPVTPPLLERAVKKCLSKDPDKRWQSAGDLCDELKWIAGVALLLEEYPQAESARHGRLPWAVAVALLLALGTISFVHFREKPPAARTLRYTIAAPEGTTNIHSFALSPDGRYLAIATTVKGKRQLWLRPLDALEAQPMPGTDDATFPFWSPDSRYIGFFAQGKLKKIVASGGPAQALCDANNGRGGSWSREDTIVFAPGASGAAIQRVPAAGGSPSDVSKGKHDSRYPLFLPGGTHFLYVVTGTPAEAGVYVSSLGGDDERRVLTDASSVVFAAGHLFFLRENALMAQPFDPANVRSSGEAFPIAEGLSFINNLNFAPVSVSQSGVLVYANSISAGSSQIVWFDRAGKVLGTLGPPGAVWEPAISPNQKQVAFRRSGASTSDLWLHDLARGRDTRFTFDDSTNLDPVWSPQGDRLLFNSNRTGTFNLYQTSGSGPEELVLSTANIKVPNQWSRDGRFIVYSERDPKTHDDLWVLPVGAGASADRKPFAFLKTEFNELKGQLSADSRWMAYTSDESGQREVYVRPFPTGSGKWRISEAGGEQPRWRADDKELFFVGADGKMMAVSVRAVADPKPSFEAGTPMPLFETHIGEGAGNVAFQYDVTADGKRFLVATSTLATAAPPLNVVVNWDAGLKK